MSVETHTQPEQPDWNGLCGMLDAARDWLGSEDGVHDYDGDIATATALIDACLAAFDAELFWDVSADVAPTPAHTD